MKTTKNQSMMAYVTLEDDTGTMELLTFSNALGQYGTYLHENSAVIVTGRISIREDKDPQMVVNRVQPLQDYTDEEVAAAARVENAANRTLYLKVDSASQPGAHKVLPILRMFPGRTRTVIYYADTGKRLGGTCMPDELMLRELRELLGEENVVLK